MKVNTRAGRLALAAAAGIALASAGAAGAGAAPVHAGQQTVRPAGLPCAGEGALNPDPTAGHVKTSETRAALHTAPGASCQIVAYAYPSQTLYYHCYEVNDAGHGWTHLRIGGTSTQGWVWDGDLADGGSGYSCPTNW